MITAGRDQSLSSFDQFRTINFSSSIRSFVFFGRNSPYIRDSAVLRSLPFVVPSRSTGPTIDQSLSSLDQFVVVRLFRPAEISFLFSFRPKYSLASGGVAFFQFILGPRCSLSVSIRSIIVVLRRFLARLKCPFSLVPLFLVPFSLGWSQDSSEVRIRICLVPR